MLLTTTIGVLFSVSSCIETPVSIYTSFVLQVIFRTFVYGGNTAFISLLFPQQHFGKLLGLTQCLVGIVSLLQIPLSTFVLNTLGGNFQYFYVGLVVVCLLTIVHPVTLFVKARTIQRAELNKQHIDESKYVKF